MRTFNGAFAALAVLAAVSVSRPASAEPYGFVDLFAAKHDGRTSGTDITPGIRLGGGVPFADTPTSRTALELGIFANAIDHSSPYGGDDTQVGAMLDLVHAFKRAGASPFVFAGLGGVKEDVATANGFYGAIEAGIGVEVARDAGGRARISLSAQEVFNDEASPTQDAYIDYRLAVGFLGLGAPAPKPAPRPVDTDGDGVPDAQDRCLAQPAATADGCPEPVAPAAPPKDTDGDGIDDSKDECPGTLEGLQVDASGCVAAASAQKIVLKGVTFLPNSAELTPDAKTVLNEAYDALAGQTSLKVEVGGHTDSMGDEKLNQSLSQRRAESVKKYLADKGIAADRLTAKGYGEGQPIADNKTRAGRQQNRRVELKILN